MGQPASTAYPPIPERPRLASAEVLAEVLDCAERAWLRLHPGGSVAVEHVRTDGEPALSLVFRLTPPDGAPRPFGPRVPADRLQAAKAKLEELCERWREVHPRCRALAHCDHARGLLELDFRIENIDNSTRAAVFKRDGIEAVEPAAFAAQLEQLYAGALKDYEPMLARLPREAP